MDQARFDHLARGLAASLTRRGLVRQLSGAACGGILVAMGLSDAAARKKKHGHGKHKRRQNQCTTCSDECAGAPEANPTKTLLFTPTGDPDFCGVAVKLTGFAGCASFTAEYWSAINTSGFRAQDRGSVTLGPTDLAGSSQTALGTYVKGGAVDIRLDGAAADYQWVDC
jgi:hypothetical protein